MTQSQRYFFFHPGRLQDPNLPHQRTQTLLPCPEHRRVGKQRLRRGGLGPAPGNPLQLLPTTRTIRESSSQRALSLDRPDRQHQRLRQRKSQRSHRPHRNGQKQQTLPRSHRLPLPTPKQLLHLSATPKGRIRSQKQSLQDASLPPTQLALKTKAQPASRLRDQRTETTPFSGHSGLTTERHSLEGGRVRTQSTLTPVSYTHLTLPTIYSV